MTNQGTTYARTHTARRWRPRKMRARGLVLACAALVPVHCFSARRSISGRRAVARAPRRATTVAGAGSTAGTEEVDVVVIGSGLGGLSAAALLSKYGKEVLCLEAHEHAGGVAHGFDRRTKDGIYKFDSGPSLWSGMSRPSTNPLRQVLDAVGEDCDWVGYDGWGLHYPSEGYAFRFTTGPDGFDDVIRRHSGGGDAAVAEWHALLDRVAPIITAAMGTPPMALRYGYAVPPLKSETSPTLTTPISGVTLAQRSRRHLTR